MSVRGRLAPSPTGMAHLGNAWAFLLAWLSVRSQGGELVLRMEDLDLERSSPVFMQMLMSDIRWLGLDWDEGPTPERELTDYHQSNRFHLYEEALDQETMEASVLAIARADMLIVGGTSLVVYPAAGLINYYRGDKLVLINRDATPYDRRADLVIHDSLGKVLGGIAV